MKQRRTLMVICLTACMAAAAFPANVKAQDDLSLRAAAIKPAPQELNWLKIPWVLDLNEGVRLAKEERRPIFLWVTGDDPLERC